MMIMRFYRARWLSACWNDWTCSVADAIFSPEAPSAETIEGWAGESGVPGLYQLDDADNPLAGWTLLHIPYCTGDVHWGNATTNYGADLEIHHRGLVGRARRRLGPGQVQQVVDEALQSLGLADEGRPLVGVGGQTG